MMKYQGFVPLYQRLFLYYRDRIIRQEIEPGARIDSINRIMDRHGVSRETAKTVLSKLASEGYIVKKAGKGSFASYAGELKKVWGIVVPFLSPNIQELISHLYQEADRKGREIRFVLHYNDPDEEMRQVGAMIHHAYEAVLIVPNFDESRTAGFYRRLSPGSTRIVLLDNTMVGSWFNYVIQSYDLGAKRAFGYLASANDSNLLFVKDESWKGNNLVLELIERSLHFFTGSLESERELIVISGIQGIEKEMIGQQDIGGILCWSDSDALRLTSRILDWGYAMPGDVALVSYGNTELTKAGRVPLTVIDCRYREMAEKAAGLIFCDECREITRQIVIEPELVVRQT